MEFASFGCGFSLLQFNPNSITFMPCDNIIQVVTRETGRFNDMIYNRVFPFAPWIALIKKDVFPQGRGDVISTLTYERSAPTDAEPTWTSVITDDSSEGTEGGTCLPTPAQIGVGSTTRTWSRAKRALHGPKFCAEDLVGPFELGQQLDKTYNVLSDRIRQEWEFRYRHEYRRLTGTKVVVNGNLTEGTSTTFPAVAATSVLTQGVLDRYYMKLYRDGAQNSALGMENGQAVLTLITDAETSRSLIFNNEDIRQDLRWAEPSQLLKPLGVRRSYMGYYHVMDPFPIRYTFSGGYSEVAPFSSTSATKGSKTIVNPNWSVAPYTSSDIFDPTVFTSRIPKPVTTPAANFRFDPVSYVGNIKVMNILNETCNPDGTILFHRAVLEQASEPVHPERGVSFVHLRCDPALNLIASCS